MAPSCVLLLRPISNPRSSSHQTTTWCHAHSRRSASHLSTLSPRLANTSKKPWIHHKISAQQQQPQPQSFAPPTGAATIPSPQQLSSSPSSPHPKPPPKPFSFFEPRKPIPPIPLDDFHFVMFATETMDDFEPPSPPSIPFGGPFEDYYGEIIGEDYIPKQEKPTSSFLMFLDSLNEKRTDLKKEEVPMPEGGFPQEGDEKKKPLDSYAPLFQHRHTPQSPKPDAIPYTPLFRNDVPPPSPSPPPSASKPSTQSSHPPSPPPPSTSPSQQKPYTPAVPQNSPPPPPSPSASQQKQSIPSFSPGNPSPPPPPPPIRPQQQRPYGFPQSGPPPPLPQQRSYAAPFPQGGPPPPPPPPLPPSQIPYAPMFPQRGQPPPGPPQPYAPQFNQGGVPPRPPTTFVPQSPSSPQSSSSSVEERKTYTSQLQQNAMVQSSPTSSPMRSDVSSKDPNSSDYVQGLSSGSRDSRSAPLIPQTRAADANRAPLFTQAKPIESTSGTGNSFAEVTSSAQPLPSQPIPSAGVSYPTPSIPLNIKASEYYEPEDGDIVLGAVISSDDDELEIEIGAQLPAILPFREFHPHPQMIENIFFKLPNSDGNRDEGFVAPYGKSLIVEDKSVIDGSYQGGIEAGTVVLAEVQGRTLTDGKAILSCRSPARRISWNRIAQVMQKGETVELEIMQCNEGGLLGYLEGTRAFLPRSELLQKPESSTSLKDYVGKVLQVAVTQADTQASNCIMSEVKAWMSKNLLLGSVHDVTVTKLYPYGMQVEIENTRIRGFVHISNISKEYVSSVATFFTEGERARVMLIKGRNPGQVSFSTAELERERGLMLRSKQQVYEEAEEAARSFYEGLSQKEREIFSLEGTKADLEFQDISLANLKWLHIGNAKV